MERPPGSPLFRELSALVTEGFLPESSEIDSMRTAEILRVIHEQDCLVAPAVGECLAEIGRVVDAVTASFVSGGRLVYVGAGTSGRLGILDASECPPTFGTAPEEVVGIIAGGRDSVFRAKEGAEDVAEDGAAAIDEHGVTSKDSVVGIAASRRTPYVQGALARAREIGAFTALVTCNPEGPGGAPEGPAGGASVGSSARRVAGSSGSSAGSPSGSVAGSVADVVVAPIVGPEVVAGSTRMKAGTAQKLVLNMITTASMIRRGKTLGNLMVDLRPGSTKLVERSRRIVMRVVGVDYDEAIRLLEGAEGSVKVAIVMGRAGIGPRDAIARLEAAGGFVRRALEAR